MKKFVLFVIAAMFLFVMGCSEPPKPQPTVTPAPPVAKPAPAPAAEMAKPAPAVEVKVETIAVYYSFNKDTLTVQAKKDLDKVAESLVKAPAMVISLDGHADARGTNAYNKTLSQKRCDSVQKYLESKGLKNKVVSTAYGEEKPVDGKIKPYFKNRVVFVKVSK